MIAATVHKIGSWANPASTGRDHISKKQAIALQQRDSASRQPGTTPDENH
jgi:hypothetical protein